MKDLDERLSDHLHTQAGHLSIAPAAVDRVVARGRQRQRRARAAAAAMLAVTVLGGVAGYQATRPDRSSYKVSVGDAPTTVGNADPTTTAAGATTVPVTITVAGADGAAASNTPASVGGGSAPLPQATLGGTGLSWQRKNPKTTLGGNFGSPGGPTRLDDRLVALSTAPAGSTPPDPNRINAVDTLYSTTDGVDWSPSKAPAWLTSLGGRGSQLFGAGTAPAEVATTLGIAEGASIVGSSNDGGKTWATVALPKATDNGPRGTRLSAAGGSTLVAGPKGMLITETSYRQVYLPDLVPAGVDTTWGITTSPAGVSVLARPANDRPDAKVCPSELPVLQPASALPTGYGTNPQAAAAFGISPWVCTPSGGTTNGNFVQLRFDQLGYPVAHTYTWNDVGTTWEQLANAQATERTYLSTDGRTFEPVTLPGSSNGRGPVVADADGFLAVENVQPDPSTAGPKGMSIVTYRSTDGRSWATGTPVDAAWSGFGGPARMADGRWAMAGQDGNGRSRLLLSDDGLDWRQLGLDDVVAAAAGPNTQANIGTFDVGPTGITAAIFTSPDLVAEHGGVKVSANGITMTITNARGEVTITDEATGTVLGTASIWSGASTALLRIDQVPSSGGAGELVPTTIGCVNPELCPQPVVPEYVVLDPATGAERARFTLAQIDKAMEPVNADQRPWEPRALILTSTDGSTWAATDLSEVAGEPITLVNGIDHVGDTVIVRAQTKRRLPASTSDNPAFVQLALVGTPKG